MRILSFIALAFLFFSCSDNGKEQTNNEAPKEEFQTDLPIESLKLPAGFELSVFADNLPDARSLARGKEGTIFVGNRSEDKVWALVDEDNDGHADRRYLLASGLRMPNGVAFKDGDLYVAEVSRVLRFSDIESKLDNPPSPEVVYDGFPSDAHHGWKYIAFGPDGKLYVPVGAPCNMCESDEIYATITRMDVQGGEPEIIARGIRNTVGFDWHPENKDLWFTDNGGDNLGSRMADAGKIPEAEATSYTDSLPPCEINHVTALGQHFGYPFCHAGEIIDPEFGSEGDCDRFVGPVVTTQAHAAPLGMKFYEGSMFPTDYKHQILVAEHGSWNRTKKVGYRIMRAAIDQQGNFISYEPFIEGWLDEESQEVWGRPVALLELPDGSLLISDDGAGAIYRVTYKE